MICFSLFGSNTRSSSPSPTPQSINTTFLPLLKNIRTYSHADKSSIYPFPSSLLTPSLSTLRAPLPSPAHIPLLTKSAQLAKTFTTHQDLSRTLLTNPMFTIPTLGPTFDVGIITVDLDAFATYPVICVGVLWGGGRGGSWSHGCRGARARWGRAWSCGGERTV